MAYNKKHFYLVYLILLVSLAYLPFLGIRVLRMAGDEKVYIAQAIEMARDGRWFVQTLADQPDYYKGPVHYILIRIGMILFGKTIFAATWMNWLFALLGGISFYFLGLRRFNEQKAFLLGLSASLTIGAYSHAFASQMEVELIGIYCLATALLGIRYDQSNTQKYSKYGHLKTFYGDLPFWLIAGFAGCIKSPVHSALIGLGALGYWAIMGQLYRRIKSLGAWMALLCGVIVCLVGYAPAYILDHHHFVSAFLGRENINKVNNGRGVDYVLRSLPHFMLPWTAAALAGTVYTVGNMFKPSRFPQADAPMAKLGLAMALPTIVFFCGFPYKGQNYNIPVTTCLILMGFATFSGFPAWSNKIASALGIIAVFIFCALIGRFFGFFNMPDWWPTFYAWGALLLICIFSVFFWFSENTHMIAVGTLALFSGFALAITPLGTRELLGLKKFIEHNPNTNLYYYNLEPTIWSEWGLMELAVGRRIQGLHDEKSLKEALSVGNALIIPGNDSLEMLKTHSRNQGISLDQTEIVPWTRWLTKGKNRHGQTLWMDAWLKRSLAPLEREYYILHKRVLQN